MSILHTWMPEAQKELDQYHNRATAA